MIPNIVNSFKSFILPTFYNKAGVTSASKITAFVAFAHVLISYWIWVIFDRIVPEHIFLAFSGIVLGALGFNEFSKSTTVNVNRGGVDNPD